MRQFIRKGEGLHMQLKGHYPCDPDLLTGVFNTLVQEIENKRYILQPMKRVGAKEEDTVPRNC